MKIALFQEGMDKKAEAELAKRFIIAAERIGHDAVQCATSDEIYSAAPDVVLSMHNNFPKLTDHPTFGCMWNPPLFFGNQPPLVRNVMSYDGYLYGSEKIRRYIKDLNWDTDKTYKQGWVFPSCYSTEFKPRDPSTASMAYVGTNWDGQRFHDLMHLLGTRNLVSFFGPRESWGHVGRAYRGTIPFDGVSLLHQLWSSGITLCLHKLEHLVWDVPNMRVFDALAASSILVSDRNKFVEDSFKDTVWYVDRDLPPDLLADQIESTIDRICSNERLSSEMARESHHIFNSNFTLERLIENLLEEVGPKQYAVKKNQKGGEVASVDCIIRTGFRGTQFLRRALDSLISQQHKGTRAIIVNNNDSAAVKEIIGEYSNRIEIKEVSIPDPRGRSNSLWVGLNEVTAKYFCILDDDDLIFRDHFAKILPVLEQNDDVVLCYSGAIKREEGADSEGGIHDEKESRQLAYLHKFDLGKLLNGENFITSNSYLARSSALDKKSLVDPELDAIEDYWLLLTLARKGKFQPTWSVTSEFSWRRSGHDNVSFQPHFFNDGMERVRARLQFMNWPTFTVGSDAPFYENREDRYWHANNLMNRRDVQFKAESITASQMGGHVDAALKFDEYIELSGWAPWRNVSPQQKILIAGVEDAELLTSRIDRRADVADFFNDFEYYRSGFTIRFIVNKISEASRIKLYARDTDGTIYELSENKSLVGMLDSLQPTRKPEPDLRGRKLAG